MNIIKAELTGHDIEQSVTTGKQLVNLNRDGATRTFDAIDFGMEIQEQIEQVYPDSGYTTLPEFCVDTFGITYEQCTKYRKLAIAAYDPDLQPIVVRWSHRGLEKCFEKINPLVNLNAFKRQSAFR